MGGKLFGFASCPRAVGAAEGMNVLAERRVKVPHSEGEAPVPSPSAVLMANHLTFAEEYPRIALTNCLRQPYC